MGIMDRVKKASETSEDYLKAFIWGPNGSGKSTLCGTADPTEIDQVLIQRPVRTLMMGDDNFVISQERTFEFLCLEAEYFALLLALER